MRHHAIVLSFFVLFTSQISEVFAVDSESHREAIVSPRSKKFYKSNRSKQYLSFGGIYSSDYNSKKYQLNSRYLYQSDNFINEINYKGEANYADKGSGDNKRSYVKTTELYDVTISSKARIGEGNNYGVFFHRTIYDNLSSYYYDLHTAIGVGRMFFKNSLEFDLSVGYNDAKHYGYKMDVIPSLRAKFKITNKLTLTQRGYWFIDHESMDNGLKTSLVYRLGKKLSIELRNNFEQRRYEDDEDNVVVNRVNRSTTIGLIFDLN